VSLAADIVSGAGLQRCEVEDLSVGGCKVRPLFPLQAGDSLRVRITSARVSFDLSGPAKVAWSSRTPPYLAGLTFDAAVRESAAQFLTALLGPVRLSNPGEGNG
jgi:hypothetical protein